MKIETFWCPDCQRAFHGEVPDDYSPGMVIEEVGRLGPQGKGGERHLCPHKGCGGAIVNCLHWSKLRENHPELPEAPQNDGLYPV